MRLAVLLLPLILSAAGPAMAQTLRCDGSDRGDIWSVKQSVYIKGDAPLGRLATIQIDAPVMTAPGTDFQANVNIERAQQPVRGRLLMEIWEVPDNAEPPMVMVQMQMPQYVSIRDTFLAAIDEKSNIQPFRLTLVAGGNTLSTSDAPLVLAKADDLDTAVDTVVSRVQGVSDAGLAVFSTPEDIQTGRDIAQALVGNGLSAELQLAALPRSGDERAELLATMPIEHAVVQAALDAIQGLLEKLPAQYGAGQCVQDQ